MPNNETGGILIPSSFTDLFAEAAAEMKSVVVEQQEIPVENLEESFSPIIQTSDLVAGNEGMLDEVFASAASHLKKGSQKLMAEGGEVARKAFRNAGNILVKQLGTRKLFISRLNKQAREIELKDKTVFSKELMNKLSGTGDVKDLESDLKRLIEEISDVLRFERELEVYYRKELNIFKNISSIKDTATAMNLITELDKLKLPNPNFAKTSNTMSDSDPLPGGKVFVVKDTGRVEVTSVEVPVKQDTISFAKDDVIAILSELNKLVDLYKQLAKALNTYGDYIKEFNTVVGTGFTELEKLKGEISINLIRDIQGRLQGNTLLYTFYSGFLPKITIYLDDYVEGFTSSLSKQFN